MNKAIPISLLLSISCFVNAQSVTRTMELKPILSHGNKFFYGGTRVRKGYSLQVPLQSLGDKEVNRKFKSYARLRAIGRSSWLIPVAFLLVYSDQFNSTSSGQANTFVWLTYGAFATNIGCNIISNAVLRKGIERYNVLIFKENTVGMRMERTFDGNHLIGVSLSRSFWIQLLFVVKNFDLFCTSVFFALAMTNKVQNSLHHHHHVSNASGMILFWLKHKEF